MSNSGVSVASAENAESIIVNTNEIKKHIEKENISNLGIKNENKVETSRQLKDSEVSNFTINNN